FDPYINNFYIVGTSNTGIVVPPGYISAFYLVNDLNNADITIQQALNDIDKNNGGVIYIREGIYTLNKPIVIKGDTYLQGDGIDKTILQMNTFTPIDSIINGNGGDTGVSDVII